MSARTAIALLALAAGGCASVSSAPSAAGRPVLLQYAPGENGGVRLSEPFVGELTQRGACLGLVRNGIYTIIIWPATARLSFDARGLALRDEESGGTVRLGDQVAITGGPLPPGTQHQLGSPPLARAMPIDCARHADVSRPDWIGVANSGFRKVGG